MNSLKSKRSMRVLISGGGTGGHIFPAIAIADALKVKYKDTEILFVGAHGKMEMDRVPAAGYPIKGLWISGFQRKLTFRNLLFPVKLLWSMAQVVGIVKRFNPDVVVGVGGYASGPALKVSGFLGHKTAIQEQNSYPGATNRLLAKKAEQIFVAYPDMDKFFEKSKIVFSGNPIRLDIVKKDISTSEAKTHLGLDQNKKTILIMGGSLGARSLNEAVMHLKELWLENPHIQLFWQVGKLYYEDYIDTDVAKLPNVNVVAFIDDMAMVYAASDIVVCRAGALTISEIAVLEKPAILIPSPNVAEDHQTKNAMALVDAGAAWMVSDANLKNELEGKINYLLDNEAECKLKGEKLRLFAKPNAANEIAETLHQITLKS